MKKTGFVWDESYFWHDIGSGAMFVPTGKYVQEDELLDAPKTKRRIKNLLDRSGLTKKLVAIEPRMATKAEIEKCHIGTYIDEVKEMSDAGGGNIGPMAVVGDGTYEIASLSVGGALTAVDAVMTEDVDNAYVLGRPAGHHAESKEGMGFCIFNNVAIAAEYARNKYGLKRVLILDWDVHHGNGAEEIFYSDPNVLFISLHQELYPFDSGDAESVGKGDGTGYNVNIPLPAGTGNEGYMQAFKEIVGPIVNQFEPELILVSAGQDPNLYDPLGRMMMTSEGFEDMTKFVMDLGEKHCDGKVVLCQEGGYNASYVPFCTLKIVETLRGIQTEVEDPFLGPSLALPKVVTSNEREAIDHTKNILTKYWNI